MNEHIARLRLWTPQFGDRKITKHFLGERMRRSVELILAASLALSVGCESDSETKEDEVAEEGVTTGAGEGGTMGGGSTGGGSTSGGTTGGGSTGGGTADGGSTGGGSADGTAAATGVDATTSIHQRPKKHTRTTTHPHVPHRTTATTTRG